MADPALARRVLVERRAASRSPLATARLAPWSPLSMEMMAVRERLIASGFARGDRRQVRTMLGSSIKYWPSFAASWNDLPVDIYMADGGRYRRRRFAAFFVAPAVIARKPHRPHFQSRTHNPLNGGIERWFDPVKADIGDNPLIQAMLQMRGNLFSTLSQDGVEPGGWHVEMHQFRICTMVQPRAEPTPEGTHRDGVDWVLVLLTNRRNVQGGKTRIVNADGELLDEFTLTSAQETVFLNDRRIRHAVTPIWAKDATAPGFRDVLVLTVRLARAAGAAVTEG